ncbi:histamine H1 receptor [Denticeps clupeoides]|uniref:Histamine H1 receptor n=1 Tax=Denticeps clupeoides TaxID=299321 RepID=A0AAY4CXA4_9TELE|nr:histamine H1 receptor [Denticeps clupeoides]
MESAPVFVTLGSHLNGSRPRAAPTSASVSLQHQMNSAFLGILLGCVALLTVIMNILVLYAVKKERTLHTVGNLYIVSLSVADLIVGATVMPLNLTYLLEDEWKLGHTLCQFWLVMDYVASTASIFSLFILCLDRYHSVRHPLQYLKYRTRGRATLMISGAWLLSMTWIIPILGWRSFARVDPKPEFEHKCDTDFRFVTWFKVLTAIVNFYIPSVLMLWFYSRIFIAVQEHYRQWEGAVSPIHSSENNGVVDSEKTMGRGSCKGSQQANATLPPRMRDETLLDQYTLEQQYDPREANKEQGKDPWAESRTSRFTHKASLFNVTKYINRGAREAAEKSFCSSPDGDSGTGSPLRLSSLPINFAQPAEEAKTKILVPVNDCTAIVPNSVAGVCELTKALNGDSGGEGESPRPDNSNPPTLKHTWQKFCEQSRQCVQNLRIHKERKAARQLGFIIAGFMLCWIPYFITFMVMAFCKTCVHHDLHMITIWLGYFNSTLNPFIYPLCNENFKRVFKQIFHIDT